MHFIVFIGAKYGLPFLYPQLFIPIMVVLGIRGLKFYCGFIFFIYTYIALSQPMKDNLNTTRYGQIATVVAIHYILFCFRIL